jgi:hypothetical protein
VTSSEKKKVARAIDLLHADEGWNEAMRILCALIDRDRPFERLMDNAKRVSIADIAASPNREFSVTKEPRP